ncbi:MAG: flagellar filament capping protein FliD [Limnohabitans sp.]|jgi:flagellar hook-associated protein 2
MATDTISALGAGSGVDVKSLAQSLVDAEKTPRKAAIDAKIKKSEGGISGYGAIKFVLNDLKTAFSNLKDLSDFNTVIPKNSQSSAFTVTTNAKATAGSHSVSVTSLAKAQRNISSGFADKATSINGGAAFSFTLTKGSGATQTTTTMNIAAGDDTPAGIVATINAYKAGINAQLVNTGDATSPYKIVVTGDTGASNNFSLVSSNGANPSAEIAGLSFGNPIQTAANAAATIDGISVTSSTNRIEGALTGVTFDLSTLTTGTASVDLSRDTTSVKANLKALVTAFNDANSMLSVVSDPKSTVETYGATLVGNSTVSNVRSQMRSMITSDSPNATDGINAFRDLGVTLNRNGELELDEAKLDTVLQTKYDSMVTMLTANRESLSTSSNLSAGAAGTAVKKLTQLLDNTGALTAQTDNLTKKIDAYKLELTKLEDRMSTLLERYNKQFGVMETMVGQSKSLQTSLKSTFDGMMSAYTSK